MDPPSPKFSFGPLTFADIGQQYFFDNISHSDSLEDLLLHIRGGTALAVSDGSYYPAHNLSVHLSSGG